MSCIGKIYRHTNGDKVRITDIDFATNTYVGKDINTGLIELIAAHEIHSGLWELYTEPEKLTNCVCGTTITLGKNDQPMFHSSWCSISKIKS